MLHYISLKGFIKSIEISGFTYICRRHISIWTIFSAQKCPHRTAILKAHWWSHEASINYEVMVVERDYAHRNASWTQLCTQGYLPWASMHKLAQVKLESTALLTWCSWIKIQFQFSISRDFQRLLGLQSEFVDKREREELAVANIHRNKWTF